MVNQHDKLDYNFLTDAITGTDHDFVSNPIPLDPAGGMMSPRDSRPKKHQREFPLRHELLLQDLQRIY